MLTVDRLYIIVTYTLIKNTGWLLTTSHGKQTNRILGRRDCPDLKVKFDKNSTYISVYIDKKRHTGLLWDYQYKVRKYSKEQ